MYSKLGLGALILVMALGIFLTVLEEFISYWPYSLYFLLAVGTVVGVVWLIIFIKSKGKIYD